MLASLLYQLFGRPGVKAMGIQQAHSVADRIGLLAGKPGKYSIHGLAFQRDVLCQEIIDTLQQFAAVVARARQAENPGEVVAGFFGCCQCQRRSDTANAVVHQPKSLAQPDGWLADNFLHKAGVDTTQPLQPGSSADGQFAGGLSVDAQAQGLRVAFWHHRLLRQ